MAREHVTMAGTAPLWHEFATGEDLASALADTVSDRLRDAVSERGAAVLAVSGGTTPEYFFKTLSRQKLDWSKVTVTLVDERFVPTSSTRSNARLVAQHLLQNEAARAQFVGLYQETASIEDAARIADGTIARLPEPLDAVVLGMGTDLHTASFFPDAESIETLLSAEDGPAVLPVNAPSAGEGRLTLSMTHLAGARFLALHIEGTAKKEALHDALQAPSDVPLPPVRAVIENSATPVQIYWAPKA